MGRLGTTLLPNTQHPTPNTQHPFTYVLIPDGDGIIEPELLRALGKVAEVGAQRHPAALRDGVADRVYVQWDTCWKSREYVIRPREQFTPCILVNLHNARPVGLRNFEGGRPLYLSSEHGIIHHLSYCGPDERILRKLATWGHRDEVVPGWYDNIWLAWDIDKLLRNLHPTHPAAYGFTERVETRESRVESRESKPTARGGGQPARSAS